MMVDVRHQVMSAGYGPAKRALKAVVELHEPSWDGMPWRQGHPDLPGCSECDDDGLPLPYPCPTVEAIQQHITRAT